MQVSAGFLAQEYPGRISLVPTVPTRLLTLVQRPSRRNERYELYRQHRDDLVAGKTRLVSPGISLSQMPLKRHDGKPWGGLARWPEMGRRSRSWWGGERVRAKLAALRRWCPESSFGVEVLSIILGADPGSSPPLDRPIGAFPGSYTLIHCATCTKGSPNALKGMSEKRSWVSLRRRRRFLD
ncbi:hypothetical protein CALCODRAFT_98705 [Calocera cornea HHB12733]|uniref:Uncharacterized protein n=1 Tax=Calocera cornea HHB12733 TaxID=1353952 RepID=A0A165D733_9BASI|nr:hypothetical protein CALCODRAFT_98705 [Calocera cornea HHB12733]